MTSCPKMKIEEDLNADALCGVKRFYPPFKISMECPICGEELVACGGAEYLSYPNINRPEPVNFYCEHDKLTYEDEDGEWQCDHETWEHTRYIEIEITAKEVKAPRRKK